MDFEITMLIIPLIVCLPIILTGIILLVIGMSKKKLVSQEPAYNGLTWGVITRPIVEVSGYIAESHHIVT